MKTKIGAILLIILATLGFSETMAAQYVTEEHSRRNTHGPLKNNTIINHLKRHDKSINHQYNYFPKGCL